MVEEGYLDLSRRAANMVILTGLLLVGFAIGDRRHHHHRRADPGIPGLSAEHHLGRALPGARPRPAWRWAGSGGRCGTRSRRADGAAGGTDPAPDGSARCGATRPTSRSAAPVTATRPAPAPRMGEPQSRSTSALRRVIPGRGAARVGEERVHCRFVVADLADEGNAGARVFFGRAGCLAALGRVRRSTGRCAPSPTWRAPAPPSRSVPQLGSRLPRAGGRSEPAETRRGRGRHRGVRTVVRRARRRRRCGPAPPRPAAAGCPRRMAQAQPPGRPAGPRRPAAAPHPGLGPAARRAAQLPAHARRAGLAAAVRPAAGRIRRAARSTYPPPARPRRPDAAARHLRPAGRAVRHPRRRGGDRARLVVAGAHLAGADPRAQPDRHHAERAVHRRDPARPARPGFGPHRIPGRTRCSSPISTG